MNKFVRACLKIRNDAVFVARAGWQGATKENTLHGSSTEEQRRHPALATKTLRAAGLLLCPKVKSPSRSIIPNFQTGSKWTRCRGSPKPSPGLVSTWPAENSPATLVLGLRCNKPSESLGDERNVLPSLAGLYDRSALAPSSRLLSYFREPCNETTQSLTDINAVVTDLTPFNTF